MLEWNVNTLLSVATLIFVAGGFYYSTRSLYTQVADIKEDLKMLNKVVMDVALSNVRQDNFEKRTDDRFKHLEEDLREMKHGKGFVKEAV